MHTGQQWKVERKHTFISHYRAREYKLDHVMMNLWEGSTVTRVLNTARRKFFIFILIGTVFQGFFRSFFLGFFLKKNLNYISSYFSHFWHIKIFFT